MKVEIQTFGVFDTDGIITTGIEATASDDSLTVSSHVPLCTCATVTIGNHLTGAPKQTWLTLTGIRGLATDFWVIYKANDIILSEFLKTVGLSDKKLFCPTGNYTVHFIVWSS